MLDSLDRKSGKSLYIQIYDDLRKDILFGRMTVGEKLPSKRALAEKLGVSLVTVENAYAQLLDEGYIRSCQRSGYYVQFNGVPMTPTEESEQLHYAPDTPNEHGTSTGLFPFTVWTKLMRAVILEKGTALLAASASNGVWELREEISRYLYRSRGISVNPRQIIVGAGTEYLYNMLVLLLGRQSGYGVEDPGYTKLSRIYGVNDIRFTPIPLDEQGMSCESLHSSGVDIAHISPAHHFPTGIVMPISRRLEIMQWASLKDDRFIIEDDYDSEFRWSGKPVPSMFGMDTSGKVIYVNTFSVTIAPSVRIGYMCLPESLCEKWHDKLSFCSCPVPVFEQYTLARFISDGYFERHINRMKKYYRRIREQVIRLFDIFGCNITEERAGLHFLAGLPESRDELLCCCEKCGITLKPLSRYCIFSKQDEDTYVVGYRNTKEDVLSESIERYT